jgi:hypothetical protein
MASEMIRLDGYSDFMAGLKDGPRQVEVAVRESLRASARKVVTRAAVYAPRRTGATAAHTSIRVGPKRVTISWLEPGAGVHEFATTYLRRNRGGGGGVAASGVKKTHRQTGHVAGGFHEVHLGGATPPRFAFKARDELADTLGGELLDAVARAVADAAGFEVG